MLTSKRDASMEVIVEENNGTKFTYEVYHAKHSMFAIKTLIRKEYIDD